MSASAAAPTAKVDLVKQYKSVGIRAVLAAAALLKKKDGTGTDTLSHRK